MNIDLFQKCLADFNLNLPIFNKAYDYYKGNSDAMRNYKMITERSNNKCHVNYVKKLVKEEIAFSVGNDITYISKKNNTNEINLIEKVIDHWDRQMNFNLAKHTYITSQAFKVYYTDNQTRLCSKVISNTEGYALCDENGEVILFLRQFKKKFNDIIYVDVYTTDMVYHFDSCFNQVSEPQKHIFSKNGIVPVICCSLSEEGINDTIYNDIKGLNDAYETNLSDISNEISDFRNAYLKVINAKLEETDLPRMKELGIIQANSSNKNVDISWLIKNINDTFIQNTLSTIEDKIYQISSHINHNERMQSNTSGIALSNRLISLVNRCKLNQKALENCLKKELEFINLYLTNTSQGSIDVTDIVIKFTPNIPQDDLMSSQIISQLGDKLSLETGLSLLSFVTNPSLEADKIRKEQESQFEGEKLLEGADKDGE